MYPIPPIKEHFALPPDVEEVTFAKSQAEYIPLPTLRLPDGRVVSQWLPDTDELQALKNGVPITLVLHTFNKPLQPITLTVGGLDLRDLPPQPD